MTSTDPRPDPGSGSGSGPGSAGWSDGWSGPWANDAQRLFRMLSDARDPSTPVGHSQSSHATAAECRHCPLCQGMALIRKSGPDILDRVADLASGLAATLRAARPAGPGDLGSDPEAEADFGESAFGEGGFDESGFDSSDPVQGRHADPAVDLTRGDTDVAPARPVIPPTLRIDITD